MHVLEGRRKYEYQVNIEGEILKDPVIEPKVRVPFVLANNCILMNYNLVKRRSETAISVQVTLWIVHPDPGDAWQKFLKFRFFG
ncbi:MAG: hypothetical protein R3281_16345 [Balneolaceae bacterium]|nr:hypothetical protein [Balneolaceae bacterium]